MFWTADECRQKLAQYPWLKIHNQRLFCKICQEVGSLKLDSSKGVYLRNNWTQEGVTSSSDRYDMGRQKTSIRRKIFDHKVSASHKSAETILKDAKKNVLPEAVLKNKMHQSATSGRLLVTAYSLAKDNRPYTAFTERTELQEANGVELGKGLHSRHSATAMIDLISESMHEKLCKEIIKEANKISVLLDESTTVSNKSCLVVYLRTSWLGDESGECFAFPLGLLELGSLTANHITEKLLYLLAKSGFTEDYLNQHLIGACSDGASVMVGIKAGVLTQLKNKFPNIFLWHCMCHRIELAINDAVDSVTQINHVKSFLDKLYSIYHVSAKAQRELAECAQSVESELAKIGRVLDVRWVASSHRSLLAVWKSYAALHKHSTDSDSAKSPKHKATYLGMKNVLESKQFAHSLAVMLDALSAVSELSQALQKESCSLAKAYQLMHRTIRHLKLQKENKMGEFWQTYDHCDGVLFGVILRDKGTFLNKNAFLQALIDNISSRLSNNLSTTHDEFSTFLGEMDILDPKKWPSGVLSPWPVGESKLKSLCKRFGLADYRDYLLEFRDFIDNPESMPRLICKIQAILNTLPVSTADCERGFSTMNILCSNLRNTLTVKHINNLMFVSLVGPPVKLFKPQHYVKLWLKTHRSADDTRTKVAAPRHNNRYSRLWKLF